MTAIELYNQGLPLKLIARKLSISLGHVGKLLRDSGYKPARLNGTRISYEQAFQAAEMDLEGYSWREISRNLGPSTKALKRAVDYYATQDPIESVLLRRKSSVSGE